MMDEPEPIYETNEENYIEEESQERTEPCSTWVMKLIAQNAASKNVFMDLSNKSLNEIPELLLGLDHIEYMYLQDNKIVALPENFFSSFPRLKWLDLRNNRLTSLNYTDIGSHRHLQTLLLSQNKIRKLPLDLGYVVSLKALNLGDNQVKFPPIEVIEKGVFEILHFLQSNLSKMAQGDGEEFGEHALEGEDTVNGDRRESYSNAASDPHSTATTDYTPPGYHSLVMPFSAPGQHHRGFEDQQEHQLVHYDPLSLSMDSRSAAAVTAGSHGAAMVPKMKISQSATLHKPVAYYQIRQQYLERSRGGEQRSIARTQSERHNELVNRYPEPPTLDIIERNILDERRKKRVREVNDKQEAIMQRRRNLDSVKQWRDESKKKQRDMYFEQMKKGAAQIKHDSDSRVGEAPFGIRRENMEMLRPEELAQIKLANIRAEDRPKPLNPDELVAIDAQRRFEEKQLEARIRTHAMDMRSRKTGPKKTSKEDLEAAQRDMQIAQQLHREIVHHRDALQHHLDNNNFGPETVPVYRPNNLHS